MHRALIGLLAATALVAVGCGGDDDDDAAATTTTAPAAAATTEAPAALAGDGAASGDDAAFCDAWLDVNAAGAAMGDPGADPVAGATALLEQAEPAAEVAPAAVAADLDAAIELLHQAVDTGDGSLVEQADVSAIDAWTVDHCGWEHLDVTAADFHFMGMPTTLPAGDYSVTLTNEGEEFHVIVIAAKKPGVTASFEELLADPAGEEQVTTLMATFAPPGASGTTSVHLEPGEYVVVCPVPLGATPDATTEPSGPPHFTAGMQQLLTVTA